MGLETDIPIIDPVAEGLKSTRINFSHLGGFPLNQNILDAMQESYNLLGVLGEIVGSKAIIKGCAVTGTTVAPGYIYINGEILYFVGGEIQDDVIIVEEVVDKEFEDGVERDVLHIRHAEFGTGTTAIPWTDFVRAYPLTSAIFLDEIRMYGGDIANIPAGWHLCNGSNGTEDLRGRFIVGHNPDDVDYDTVGNTGGEKEHTLTVDEMPAHNHTAGSTPAGSHNHNTDNTNGMVRETGAYTTGISTDNTLNEIDVIHAYPLDYDGSHQHTITVQNKGGGQAHENRPPYYALAFIQFKGI